MKYNRDTDSIDRRSFLKTAGASAATLTTMTGVGSAEPGFHETIERAQLIRNKTGSQEAFLKYIRKHGYEAVNKRYQYSPQSASSDGISTQKLNDGNLTVDLVLVYRYFHCSLEEIYTEYSWDWNNTDSYGEPPKDYVSLGWPTDHYDYQGETHGADVSLFDRSNSLNGAIWDYEDNQLGSGDSDYAYAGCYLKETTTDQDRHVGGKYRHTFQDVEVSGWGFGSDGSVSVSFSPVDKVWRSGYEQIYESEADYEYNNC